ncbi:hypothetical protein GCK72_003910 [Caenorhabditis remanei]|uniref:Sdz-33 F-box domain-containing protein n=1 Tax=Caenorhabditis remanei TaxID=31234 RepID=A0A6A5HAV8_CAERE|nr:hypothetical protein GCK72_003910 [Caenorhabditis remanei]KAF1763964.1 hypothetical protein GCK72_003910 [Caenorhabditis remanei]
MENKINRVRLWPHQLPSVPQYTLKLYYSGNLVPTINQWTTYLSNVFNVLPTSLSLEYNCFENGTINKIMDAYCTDVNSMKHVELINNEELNQSKDAIISFLQRQNATEKIKLLFQPITDFVFDFKLLRNIPSCIKCKYANWITYKQLLEFESESVYLSRSNFTNSDFKNLVVKWRNGWNPTWKDLMIEFREELNIDAYISDSYIEINREDHYRNVLMRDNKIRAYRFEIEINTVLGAVLKTGYHLTRPDQSIATVTMENNKIGWFHIQPNNPDGKMIAQLSKRTFNFD